MHASIEKYKDTGLFVNYTSHAKARMQERKFRTQQVTNIITNRFRIEGVQKATRKNIYKFRVTGKDHDNSDVCVVFLMETDAVTQIKRCNVLTVFFMRQEGVVKW